MLLNNRSHAKDGFRGKDSSILLMLAPPESFFVSKKTTAVRTDFFIKKSKASMSEQLLRFGFMLYYLNGGYIC